MVIVYIYLYKTYEIALKQHYTHTHTHITVLLLLWVERARVYKSLYEVSCCSSAFKRLHIYVQFLNWVVCIFALIYLYVYMCA